MAGRKSSHLWNDFKQSGLVMDCLRERGRKLQGQSLPPVFDRSLPVWLKSIWLIVQPSLPKHNAMCPTETFFVRLLPWSYCVCLCYSSLLATCLCTWEEQKHDIRNVTAGGPCELETRGVNPADAGVLWRWHCPEGKVCHLSFCMVSHGAALHLTVAKEANRVRTCENIKSCLKEVNSRQSLT